MKSRKKIQKRSNQEKPKGGFWTFYVKGRQRLQIGRFHWPSMVVMKNYGPAKIAVETTISESDKLSPGELRTFYVGDKLEVVSLSSKGAVVEFQLLPVNSNVAPVSATRFQS